MASITWGLYGGGHNDFDAGNIHYKGHWKVWSLKIKTFGPKKIEICYIIVYVPERLRVCC